MPDSASTFKARLGRGDRQKKLTEKLITRTWSAMVLPGFNNASFVSSLRVHVKHQLRHFSAPKGILERSCDSQRSTRSDLNSQLSLVSGSHISEMPAAKTDELCSREVRVRDSQVHERSRPRLHSTRVIEAHSGSLFPGETVRGVPSYSYCNKYKRMYMSAFQRVFTI